MGVNKQNTIKWFDNRKGKLTYSMTGSRNGVDGTADCSGSITQAIKDAGAVPYDYLYSTVTLASYLAKNGYKLISANQDWDAKAGDIILMSWGPSMAYSGGAGGHVGVMKDDKTFISVDYWTGGQRGTAVSEHDWNHYNAVNAPMYIEAWRLEDKSSPAPNKPTNKPSKPQSAPSNTTGQKVNQGIYRADDLQRVNGIWQVRCNFLVPTEFNWTDNGISVDDIVLVDSNGYILKDQTTKTGSLFVFNTNYIKSVSGAQTGSGGYKWCKVNLSHSGNIWLSVMDKNDLIHKVSNV